MRCSNCCKFVSFDEPQCEVGIVEVDDLNVHASVTVNLNCAECGDTLKYADIEADTTIEHKCKPIAERDAKWTPDPEYKEGDDKFEVEFDGDAEGESRQQTKDRNGKPIRSQRYMKTFYGFTLESDIKCRKCGELFSIFTTGEEQASGFNEQ